VVLVFDNSLSPEITIHLEVDILIFIVYERFLLLYQLR
jgi:hypothetical protein